MPVRDPDHAAVPVGVPPIFGREARVSGGDFMAPFPVRRPIVRPHQEKSDDGDRDHDGPRREPDARQSDGYSSSP